MIEIIEGEIKMSVPASLQDKMLQKEMVAIYEASWLQIDYVNLHIARLLIEFNSVNQRYMEITL